MRNISILLCLCYLCFVAIGNVCVQAQTKNANGLWDDYQTASINANAVSSNYNLQVYAVVEVDDLISQNKKTLSDAATSTLKNLFAAGGLCVLSAPTIFIHVLGPVTPTLEWVEGKIEEKDLEALKVLADQATSDAHAKAADSAKEKTDAYDAYLAQFAIENPGYGDDGYTGPAPKAPTEDTNHAVYLFPCYGGCDSKWDRIKAAEITHLSSEVCGASGVSGCGESYYTCDSQHQAVSCTNFIGYECGVSFRPCSNGYCTPSGSLWTYRKYHSAVSSQQGHPLSFGISVRSVVRFIINSFL